MKKMIIMVLLCLITTACKSQIYGGDTRLKMPTTDLYDSQVMGMSIAAQAQMAAKVAAYRKARFEQCQDKALNAFQNRQWVSVINNVNLALETTYYNGEIYYMRGYAYEQLGYFKEAKKDYQKGGKYGFAQACIALESLKTKMKKK